MVAVAIGGAAIVGAGATMVAGSKAAKAQKKAAQAAQDTANTQYQQTRADLAPNREYGYGALDKLASMYGVARTDVNGTPTGGTNDNGTGYANDGGFKTSPGYEFRRAEGLRAIDRAGSARGLLNSGGADRARMRYADGLASSEFSNYTARIAQLAGVGQDATNTTVAAGTTAAGQVADAQIRAGNATASGYANTGSAINTGINNLASAYLYNKSGYGGGALRPEVF